MIVVNPLLQVSEFLTSDMSHYQHDGMFVPLGVGHGPVWGWYSPVEVNFSETPDGRSTRGRTPLRDFYVVRQEAEKRVWHWSGSAGRAGAWHRVESEFVSRDDPLQEIPTYVPLPPVVSFYDSPGFMTHSVASLPPTVQRVCGLQNFRLWVEVAPAFTSGRLPVQAANDVLWHSYLCLERAGSSWRLHTADSVVGRGRLQVDRPFWH
jgi:hypothetical protein